MPCHLIEHHHNGHPTHAGSRALALDRALELTALALIKTPGSRIKTRFSVKRTTLRRWITRLGC
ncbi:hypothetical protein HPP92_004731 [Vanilla planifolia]|uniref:Uncharacterized protein n=1 Tax=Vanilla planifolia TaxID=51239 RepID=A0A835RX96_VANPL|nr:hypothetical protein HPP92_005088 [Vanilla planifolia]KAG0493737.1 hypothetical protein HPP92_004731 [Vanilla planifolia]